MFNLLMIACHMLTHKNQGALLSEGASGQDRRSFDLDWFILRV